MNDAQRLMAQAIMYCNAESLEATICNTVIVCNAIRDNMRHDVTLYLKEGRTAEARVAGLAVYRMDQMLDAISNITEAAGR
ncbi:hypothetical protein [Allohahella sp. A8]|uniref:hypothetical protein n=1 Tax=Allohahella sp. A8 TaxID=3141461 RepID=UPI003A8039C6